MEKTQIARSTYTTPNIVNKISNGIFIEFIIHEFVQSIFVVLLTSKCSIIIFISEIYELETIRTIIGYFLDFTSSMSRPRESVIRLLFGSTKYIRGLPLHRLYRTIISYNVIHCFIHRVKLHGHRYFVLILFSEGFFFYNN